MLRLSKLAGLFLLAAITGGLYAVIAGLFIAPFRAPVLAWPVLTVLFWVVFAKFKLFRFAGFLWAIPVALIGFEWFWGAAHPGMIAHKYMSEDRSHYLPGSVTTRAFDHLGPGMYGFGVKEAFFGPDGFRADPATGEGNPPRCQFALIGDSMIYGSGLPYSQTLGPVLAAMGMRACVFGVTGNSPVDYLATARYAADRIDAGAVVAYYLYAYNDFVSLNQYVSRRVLSFSNRFTRLFKWAWAFDDWRRGTFMFARFAGERSIRKESCLDCAANRSNGRLWEYPARNGATIKFLYPSDPANYHPPDSLNRRERAALDFFFAGVADLSRGRSWRVAIIIHPDDAEFYANLARGAPDFLALDPRRAEALQICKEYGFFCVDISRYLYRRALQTGDNPYFLNNRHFSVAGTRMLAENFIAETKLLTPAGNAASNRSRGGAHD